MFSRLKKQIIIFGLFLTVMFVFIPFSGQHAKGLVGYLMFLEFIVLLPWLVLVSKDALDELNYSKDGHPLLRVYVRITASLPSVIFGLLALIGGVSLILWILYNVFIERLPEFRDTSIFTRVIGIFGMGPALIFFGFSILSSVLGLKPKTSPPMIDEIEDEEGEDKDE